MEEEYYQILEQLPYLISNDNEISYLNYIKDLIEKSFNNDNYFAIGFGCHLLFILVVYYKIQVISHLKWESFKLSTTFHSSKDELDKKFKEVEEMCAKPGRNNLKRLQSCFDIGIMAEKNVLELFTLIISDLGESKNVVGKLKKIVNDRNIDLAHVNGNTYSFEKESSTKKLQDINNALNGLQKYWLNFIEEILVNQEVEKNIDDFDLKNQIEEQVLRIYNLTDRDLRDIATKQYKKTSKLFIFSSYFKQNYT